MRGPALRFLGVVAFVVGAASTATAIVQPPAMTKAFSAIRPVQPANIFVKDNRVAVTPSGKFFYLAPIGELVSNKPLTLGGEHGYAESTGFMVSPCHVLTVYHGVFGDSLNPNNIDFSNTLYLGFDGHGKPKFRAKATPVIWGSGIGDLEDWALLQIDPCRGASSVIGWMNLGSLSGERWGSNGVPAALAGFMSDKPNGRLYLDPTCHLYQDNREGEWVHDCATVEEASGSPIFIMKPGGLPEVVGIANGAEQNVHGISKRFTKDISNTASEIDYIRANYPGFQRQINRGLQFFAAHVVGAHNPQLDMLKAENSSP